MSKILATVVRGGNSRDRNRQEGRTTDRRRPLDKDQCAYCKEKGHWARECPKKRNGGRPTRDKILTLEEEDWGSQGSDPLPEPRVTLKVEGEPVQFLVVTGAQHPVLLHSKGPLSTKRSWVQGATGNKQYSWTTRRTVDLGVGRVTHSFLVIPECPYPLLGRDLLSKVGAQIHFQPEGPTITDNQGRLLQILTMKLEDEHRIYETPSPPQADMQDWMTRFPQAWAETAGMGMAKYRPPVVV